MGLRHLVLNFRCDRTQELTFETFYQLKIAAVICHRCAGIWNVEWMDADVVEGKRGRHRSKRRNASCGVSASERS